MGVQTVQQVVDVLQAAGISMALTPELALKITPASFLTPELRDLIRASKEMLIPWLQHDAANDLQDKQNAKVPARREATPADPDRWCWPHSPAMNGEEIDTFTARLALFTDKGMGVQDAELLADELVVRDRRQDDRRLCLECTRLTGHAAQLPGELVCQPQRCDGFIPNSPSPLSPETGSGLWRITRDRPEVLGRTIKDGSKPPLPRSCGSIALLHDAADTGGEPSSPPTGGVRRAHATTAGLP